jgi:hypothetical protein
VTEQWRPVLDFEDLYGVSDLGRVRSLDREIVYCDGRVRWYTGQILTPVLHADGAYVFVTLCRSNRGFKRRVHHLVLAAFVGPRPPGLEGCHNDGDIWNNRPENLRWDTHQSNMVDTVRHGRHHNANKTCTPSGAPYDAIDSLGRRYNRAERKQYLAAYHQRHST